MRGFLYKIYKVIFFILVFLYIHTLLQIVNYFISSVVIFFLYPFNFKSINGQVNSFKRISHEYSEGAKDEWLEYVYLSRNNLSMSILDWCPKFITAFVALNFRDDCDSFAYLSYITHNKKPKMYVVIPYYPKNFHNMRIIAVFNGKIYAKGDIYDLTLEDYISLKYTFVDCLITRYF